MNIAEVKELLELLEEHSFDEFEYEDEKERIALRRHTAQAAEGVPVQAAPVLKVSEEPAAEEEDEFEFILSPMVGTFYNSPSPDSPTYVKVGDTVKSGDIVCIVEAMKMMNEIECPFDSEIISVIVSNEQKVEYGQPLFKIKKV